MPAILRPVGRLALAAICCAAIACGDDPGTGPKGATGDGKSLLRLVAGANTTDTVMARQLQGLVVEVRDDEGALRSGIVVRFESAPSTDSLRPWERGMFVCSVSVADCSDGYWGGGYFVADSTDARGRAVAQVRHASLAGATWITVTVPEFGLRDSFPYTTLPGNPARVIPTIRDTAVLVGASYSPGARVVDRFFNARTDAVTYTAGPHVSVSGTTVTATSVGRGRVLLTAGPRVDTAWTSVVPAGRFAAVAGDGVLAVANFDGTGVKRFSGLWMPYGTGLRPAWLSSAKLLFHNGTGSYDGYARLTTLDVATGAMTVLNKTPSVVASELYPDVAPTAGRIVFSGNNDGSWWLWRIATDGTGATRVPVPSTYYGTFYRPAISPDGSRIAVVTSAGVELFDANTGNPLGVTIAGTAPRWSPDGAWVAVSRGAGGLQIVRADGSETRTVTTQPIGDWIDWSADGNWFVVSWMDDYPSSLALLGATTGEVLPLRFAAGWYQPAVQR